MVKDINDFQHLGKEQWDLALKSFGALSNGAQAIAVEFADYSKRSFEEGTAAAEKLFGAQSLDKAIEIQSDYWKTAYETFVSQATKIGGLYVETAKEAYKPFERYLGNATAVK